MAHWGCCSGPRRPNKADAEQKPAKIEASTATVAKVEDRLGTILSQTLKARQEEAIAATEALTVADGLGPHFIYCLVTGWIRGI